MKNLGKIALLAVLLTGVVSCGGTGNNGSSFDPDNNTLNYQWEDATKPIVAEKGSVRFNITAAKNSLALKTTTLSILYSSMGFTLFCSCTGSNPLRSALRSFASARALFAVVEKIKPFLKRESSL